MADPIFVPFSEFAPDDMAWQSQGSPAIKNVVPDDGEGYNQQNDLDTYTSALTAYARGAIGTKDKGSVSYVYAGDATKLYSLSNTTWTNISQTAGYSNDTADMWSFANFQNVIIASNYKEDMQAMTAGGTLMQALGGGAPKARHVFTGGEFLFALNTNDTDGAIPHRLRWSGIRVHTTWTPSGTTLADYQNLDIDAGPGRGGVEVGGRVVVFQERAISICSFIGPPVVFQIDKVEAGRGLYAEKAFAVWGGVVYYLSQDGFYALIGGRSEPIGTKKLNKWFFNDFDVNYLHRITCAVNPKTGIVYFAYPGSGNSSGHPNKLLAFNPRNGRWAYSEPTAMEMIFIAASTGYTLDELDSISASLDALPESLDSSAWKGGQFTFAGFDTAHKLGFFSGSALTASFDTKEMDLANGNFVRMRGVKPVVDGGTHTAQIGYRRNINDSLTWTGVSSEQGVSGICPLRTNAPYQRARISVSGGFTNAKGAYFYPSMSGRR